MIFYFLAAYCSVLVIKGWYVGITLPFVIGAARRASFRIRGEWESGRIFYPVMFYTAGAILVALWPILLFVEGRRILFPYSLFAARRNTMRGIFRAHSQ